MAAGREVSAGRRTPAEAFWSAVPVAAIGGGLAAATLLVFGLVGSGPGSSPGLLLLAAGFVVANVFFALATTMLRAVGHFTLEAVLFGGSAVAFVAIAIGVTAAGLGLTAVLAALVIKEALSALIAYLALRSDLRRGRARALRGWRTLLGIGIRMGVASVALAVATRCELIILGNAAKPAAVAWFSAPLRIADAVLVAALTAGYALLPGATFLAGADRDRARRLVWRIVAAVVLVGAVLAALGAAAAEPVVTLLFGAKFSPAAEPARIILAALPAYGALGIVWYGLLAFDAERELMRVAAVCALGALVAGLVAIPTAGDVGAAWVYAVTLTIMAVAGAWQLRHATVRRAARAPRGRRGARPRPGARR
jgi:O-antigen/teichoic acid export membrane protein